MHRRDEIMSEIEELLETDPAEAEIKQGQEKTRRREWEDRKRRWEEDLVETGSSASARASALPEQIPSHASTGPGSMNALPSSESSHTTTQFTTTSQPPLAGVSYATPELGLGSHSSPTKRRRLSRFPASLFRTSRSG